MRPRRPTLNDAQRYWAGQWWRALQPRAGGDEAPPLPFTQLGRTERARLRRCSRLEELVVEPAALILAHKLIDAGGAKWPLPDDSHSYRRLALVAGVLVMVKSHVDDGQSLARRLGKATGKEPPPLSETRFKRLQRTQKLDDLLIQWRRAVQLADAKADVVQLCDDLITWLLEVDFFINPGSGGVKFFWAHDYYLSSREQNAAQAHPPLEEPIV